jgi:hypothetical protein
MPLMKELVYRIRSQETARGLVLHVHCGAFQKNNRLVPMCSYCSIVVSLQLVDYHWENSTARNAAMPRSIPSGC